MTTTTCDCQQQIDGIVQHHEHGEHEGELVARTYRVRNLRPCDCQKQIDKLRDMQRRNGTTWKLVNAIRQIKTNHNRDGHDGELK